MENPSGVEKGIKEVSIQEKPFTENVIDLTSDEVQEALSGNSKVNVNVLMG